MDGHVYDIFSIIRKVFQWTVMGTIVTQSYAKGFQWSLERYCLNHTQRFSRDGHEHDIAPIIRKYFQGTIMGTIL